MKNPFKAAKNADEFILMLRKELEKIRGKKFRFWKVSQVWVSNGDNGDRLVFTIDADRIKTMYQYGWIDWCELANGGRFYDFPKRSLMERWRGFKDFDIHSSSGGSGSMDSTYYKTAYVYLKQLPLIAEEVARNAMIARGEKGFIANNVELRELRTQIGMLQDKYDALQVKLRNEYRSEHPTFSPINGRLER